MRSGGLLPRGLKGQNQVAAVAPAAFSPSLPTILPGESVVVLACDSFEMRNADQDGDL